MRCVGSANLGAFLVCCVLTACGESPRSRAAEMWEFGRPIAFDSEQLAALDKFFALELKWADASMINIEEAPPAATEEDEAMLHGRALSGTAAPAIKLAKEKCIQDGSVRVLPRPMLGGPWIDRDSGYALVFGTYPEIGALAFRIDKDQQPDVWPLLVELERSRRLVSDAIESKQRR